MPFYIYKKQQHQQLVDLVIMIASVKGNESVLATVIVISKPLVPQHGH